MCHQGANPGNLPANTTFGPHKHNGTIHLRSRVGSRNAPDNYRASVGEDIGQVF